MRARLILSSLLLTMLPVAARIPSSAIFKPI